MPVMAASAVRPSNAGLSPQKYTRTDLIDHLELQLLSKRQTQPPVIHQRLSYLLGQIPVDDLDVAAPPIPFVIPGHACYAFDTRTKLLICQMRRLTLLYDNTLRGVVLSHVMGQLVKVSMAATSNKDTGSRGGDVASGTPPFCISQVVRGVKRA